MTILGIDPGKTGGLALFNGKSVMVEPMPIAGEEIDLAELCRWIGAHKEEISHVYLERAGALAFRGRKQGAVGMFRYGDGFGAIRGILTALGLGYTLVSPLEWTRLMHAGTRADLEAKQRSAIAVSRLFPTVDLRASERSKKPHEGMMDALLIAAYGYRIRQRG